MVSMPVPVMRIRKMRMGVRQGRIKQRGAGHVEVGFVEGHYFRFRSFPFFYFTHSKDDADLSRATDQLIVVGDPDVVTQMGGAEVARRLGIS